MTRFFHRSRWDEERARELEAHLAIETDENIARGMPPADARAAARRKLGNATRIREEIYEFNSIALLETIWQDLRFGLRLLRLNPAFAAVAVLSLALGVGANTAIFQLLNAVRLRSLPVAHPEQLAEVRIKEDGGISPSGGFNGDYPMLTNPLWERVRDRQEAFSSIFAWSMHSFELSSGGESRRAEGVWVSGDFFNTLDVRAAIGRTLTPADDQRGCASPPVVLGYGFWQREYAGSPSALGRTLTLDGHPYDIVGVAPADFFGVDVGRQFDVAVPLCAEPFTTGSAQSWLDRKDAWFLAAIGRLKPGWTIDRASAHLKAISGPMFKETLPVYQPQVARAYLAYKLGAFPAGTGLSALRESYATPLWLLLAITALVLLTACANLANLMLARATARERELAVRLALGASRGRIVRQLLAESLLIAAAGSAAAALAAQWLSRALVASMTTTSERIFVDVAADWRVFSFVTLIATAACAIFGLLPAVRVTAANSGAAMKAGARGSSDTGERMGLRSALVVAQVALSLVLVVGALLFVRSFRNLMTAEPGFSRDGLLIVQMDYRRTGIPFEKRLPLYVDVLDRLRHQPGVESAAQVRNVPVGGSFSNRNVVVGGIRRNETVNYNVISDRYFATLGTPLLVGRDFDRRDTPTSARVTIVTEAFARAFFGGRNPIGLTFQIDEPPDRPNPVYEIVGLAKDSKFERLRDAFEPLMYVPMSQDVQNGGAGRIVIRSRMPLSALSATVTAVVREAHPSIVASFRSMETQLKESVLRERLMAVLSGLFGGLAALIAMVGVYGVMSYAVARRRHEIGIRMALGADRRQVIGMVMRNAGRLLAIGLGTGALFALVAGRAAAAFLFGVAPHDPLTLAAAALGLALTAAIASGVPALRASSLSPTEALRED